MAVKITIKNLSIMYDSIRALDNISISVEAGKITALVGPNGAGKTTLLKSINGILKPFTGVVLIDGLEVAKIKSRDLAMKVGYVPQSASPYLPFTVFEVVLMGRRPYINWIVSERDIEIVNRILKIMKIDYLRDRYFDEISAGEKQKVMIARALAQEPEILLLDEPTSNLDLRHQIEILGLVRELCKEKKLTVMMAMHDLNLAYRYSDFIIMLKNGKIHAYGEPSEVLTPENIRDVYGVDVFIVDTPFRVIIPTEVIRD